MNTNSLSELLQTHRHARRTITYHDGEQEQRSVSFGELYERALGILHHLQRLGERLRHFAEQQQLQAAYARLERRAFVTDDLVDIGRAGRTHAVRPDYVAFIQLSSVSTSSPKGVVLTHANLLANLRGSTAGAGFNDQDVALSWMPLTHDMGLIGFHIYQIANRATVHQMATELFVRRPVLWLQLAARIGATLLCSPNFGYRHYLKVLGDRPVSDLDLSAVRLIFNGAEPISLSLCDEFMDRMASARLARNAMFPVYGLAEASVAVSFPPIGQPYHATHFDRHQLGSGQRVVILPAGERNALSLVAVGGAVPECELRIAADDDRPLADEHVGHIQIRGANVTAGYLDAPEVNAAMHSADGWLRTGDLGAIHAGELYITGRHKEIVFVNGQNYYPHDLEALTLDLPGMELGKVVVSGVRAPGADTDQLVVFVLHRGEVADFLTIAQQVARRIAVHAGLEVGAVVPVRRIPKTTSGKVQRHLLEEEYLGGLNDADLASLRALAAQQGLRLDGGSAIEAQLQQICDSALDGRRLGPNDSLFDIGVSSLKLMGIHESIEQRWPGLLELSDLFDHPSVAELAHFLEARQAARGSPR